MNAADVFTTLDVELKPDPSRTVIRPFSFGYPPAFEADHPPRMQVVVDRIQGLDDAMRARMLELLLTPMRDRHRNAEQVLLRRFEEVRPDIGDGNFSDDERLLIGCLKGWGRRIGRLARNPGSPRPVGGNESSRS